MKVLVTGHDGYIGTALVPMFEAAGHDVIGLDSGLFRDCAFGPASDGIPSVREDIRTCSLSLAGYDAIVHLAGISNDPLGDLDARTTLAINHLATTRLARLAKQAGVERFVFSSSCSVYGAHSGHVVTEDSPVNPVTPYGESKVFAEHDLLVLADDRFSPVILRNATAYGVSPRLRGDLVVNNLVGHAVTEGRVLLKSDGSAWRPLVHVSDIARAFLAVVEAPRHIVHGRTYNVGASQENYRVRDVASMVRDLVADSRLATAAGAGPDKRDYRVNCDRLAAEVPSSRPQWTLAAGIEQLRESYLHNGLTLPELTGTRYQRVQRVLALQAEGRLNRDLRWIDGQ